MDKISKIEQFKSLVNLENTKRGWDPVLSDCAKSIMIESAELLEHFQWDETDLTKPESETLRTRNKNWNEIELEVADIFWYLLTFCNKSNIDLAKCIQNKLKVIQEKYPEEMFKGKFNNEYYLKRKEEYRKGIR